MPDEKVEAMHRAIAAFNRGDKEAWLDTMDEDAVMIPAREWPENAPIRGAAAIWDFYVEVTRAWEEGSFELGEAIVEGDRILIENRRELRGKSSGVGTEFGYWLLATFRKGKMARLEWFSDRARGMEAIGLSEEQRP